MDLQQLSKQIEQLDSEPPFHLWNPTFCGDMDLIIRADGSWWYMGSPIGRERLVKLFARVLILENNEYFLKTPAEKIRIQVEDAPFVITDWQFLATDAGQGIQVISNLGHKVLLSISNPLEVNLVNPDEPRPYVTLHRQLKARVHRNVYYQWIEIGQEKTLDGQTHILVSSMGEEFSLGTI